MEYAVFFVGYLAMAVLLGMMAREKEVIGTSTYVGFWVGFWAAILLTPPLVFVVLLMFPSKSPDAKSASE